MVMFNSPYYSSLDRGYHSPIEPMPEPMGVEQNDLPPMPPELDKPYMSAEEGGLTVGEIGQGVPMGIAAQNVAGVDAKLRSGVNNLEIQFAGTIRGNRNAQTPEQYGKHQREIFKEIARAREVSFTTHAAFGIMGLAGQDQQGNYSMEQRETAISEIKRAVDFAAEAAQGGSVVVHTGEFQRPISQATGKGNEDWRYQKNPDGSIKKDKYGQPVPMFKGYEEEGEEAIVRVVDDRTGQVMQQVRKNQDVAVAKWRQIDYDEKDDIKAWNKRFEESGGSVRKYAIPTEDEDFLKRWDGVSDGHGDVFFRIKKDANGRRLRNPDKSFIIEHVGKRKVADKDYLDYENRIIIDPLDVEHGRLPEYNEGTGRFTVDTKGWEHFEKEADEWNKLEEKKMKLLGKKGKLSAIDRLTPEERYLRATLETNEGYSRGWALQFSIRMKESGKRMEGLRKALDFYEKLEKDIPEEEKWKIMRSKQEFSHDIASLMPTEQESPAAALKRAIWQQEQELAYNQQSGFSQEKQARDSQETQQHIKSAWKYALQKSTDSYAKLGIHALRNTEKHNLHDRPVMITMENIFPESYGAHPQELKELILDSRQKMVQMLTQKEICDPFRKKEGEKVMIDNSENYRKGLSRQEAEKIAERHIKATLDTGHLNVWRKYFQGDDKDFDKWFKNQVTDLAKNDIIGNVHLADNFGYQDDHLSPGQGNAPIREAVKILKKHGYKGEFTVEPGAAATTGLSDVHGLMETWSYFGAPVHGNFAVPQPDTWTGVQHSYFGRTYPPRFTFGAYVPSEDWTLWSQVPME